MKKIVIYTACLLMAAFSPAALQAQSLGNISGAVKKVSNHFTGVNLTGTWNYSGSSVSFESDNLLRKAGGALAASRLENSIDEQLARIGFQPGISSFTFNDDGTFANTLNGRTLSGTYAYDSGTGYLTLKYAGRLPLKAKVSGGSNRISLLFESSGLLSLVSFVGSSSGNSLLGGLSSILDSYDGMMTGMEFSKQ